MKTILNSILMMMMLLAAGLMTTGCNSDEPTTLSLDGETRIESISVNGYAGVINQESRIIDINLPTDTDLTDLVVDAITLSPGATCDYPAGTHFNALVPRSIKVTNGSVSLDYTLNAHHDRVEFLSFILDGKYAATIDNEAHTIKVFVPLNTNVSSMTMEFEVNEGTEVTPASGSAADFTSDVKLTAVHNTATVEYTVSVILNDMSQDPKAFIGNASSVDLLGDEAKAACKWMLENVPNSRYVSVQELLDGTANINDFRMVWCHFDWTDWPGTLWDSRDIFNGYWLRGGSILATRDGARYINDVWRIALDQQSPNDMTGGESYSTLSAAAGVNVKGHESHPLFAGLTPDADGLLLLQSAGCSTSGRTLQWLTDRDPYGTPEGWSERTGATALASSETYNPNCVIIAEFLPYEALKGFETGRVVTIGAPSYEWADRCNTNNSYADNRIQLTKNAINYLCQ